jgi:hypothetical protein
MAENKNQRITNLLPYIILIFALISTVLIATHIGQNLAAEGILQIEPTATAPIPADGLESIPTLPNPTPTLPPINDA